MSATPASTSTASGTSPTSAAPPRPQRWPWAVLAGLALLLAIFRLHFLRWPWNCDIALYATIGHEMLHGRSLYSDLWDHKPPLLYLTYAAAELAFGYNDFQIYALNVLAGWAMLLGLYRAAIVAGLGEAAGLWSAAFWVALSCQLDVQLHEPNTEAFLLPLLTWAFVWLIPAGPTKAIPWRHVLASGTLLALASLYKSNAVGAAAALALGLLLAKPAGTSITLAIRQAMLLAIPGLLGWIAVFSYFAATGHFTDAYQVLIEHNRHHAGSLYENLAMSLNAAAMLHVIRGLPVLWPVAGLALLGLARGLLGEHRRVWILLLVFAPGCYLTFALPGKFFPQYFQLWLPPLLLAAGWATSFAAAPPHRPPAGSGSMRALRFAPTALAAAGLLMMLRYELPPQFTSIHQLIAPRYEMMFLHGKQLALRLDSVLGPNEQFFVLGNAPEIYMHSRRRIPGLNWCTPTATGSHTEQYVQRVLTDLQRMPPEVVVMQRSFLQKGPQAALESHVRSQYVPVRDNLGAPRDLYEVMVRRGSRLDQNQAHAN